MVDDQLSSATSDKTSYLSVWGSLRSVGIGEAGDQQPPPVSFHRSADKLLVAENMGWFFAI